ncbi:MAG: hypothetical protein KAS67_06365 [Thermoplasmata archaeon]|nr:hypothetical protein [Thermoplasmata archaeon]
MFSAPLAPLTQTVDAQAVEVVGYTTGFNVTRDGYNFDNYGSYAANTPGHCYGISITSILYYEGMKDRPGGAATTYDITFDDTGEIVHEYQKTWEEVWEDQELAYQTHRYNLTGQYHLIRDQLRVDNPVMVLFYLQSDLGGYLGHATVAYRAVEYSDNTARVYVYDPNFCYDGSENYIQYFTLNFNDDSFYYTGNLWSDVYGEYKYIIVAEAQLSDKDVFWMTHTWLVPSIIIIVLAVSVMVIFFFYRRMKQKDLREFIEYNRRMSADDGRYRLARREPEVEEEIVIPGLSKPGDKPREKRPRPASRTRTVDDGPSISTISLGKDDDGEDS